MSSVLPDAVTRCDPDSEHVNVVLNAGGSDSETAATPESLLLYFHHRDGNLRHKYSYETTQEKVCLSM